MSDKGTCVKHGEFILTEGCPGCLAERRARGITPEQDEMENGLNAEGYTLATEPFIVKVLFHSKTTGEFGGRGYTYYSEDPLKVGDIVSVPVRGTTTKAKVSEVDVPESEIEAFKSSVKTIPPSSIVLDETMFPIIDAERKEKVKVRIKVTTPEEPTEEEVVEIVEEVTNLVNVVDEIVQGSESEIALALRLGEDLETHGYFQEAQKLLKYAEARVITTIEDIKFANDDLALIGKLKRAMEDKRKLLLDPLKLQVDAIRETYTYLMTPILEADKITRDKMLAFDVEQKRIRAEQEDINLKRMQAAQQEMKLKGELSEPVGLVEVAPEPVKSVSTEMGSSGIVDHWKYEIIDLALIPREYMLPDSVLLGNTAKKYHDQKEVPGVRFYNEPYIASRAR